MTMLTNQQAALIAAALTTNTQNFNFQTTISRAAVFFDWLDEFDDEPVSEEDEEEFTTEEDG